MSYRPGLNSIYTYSQSTQSFRLGIAVGNIFSLYNSLDLGNKKCTLVYLLNQFPPTCCCIICIILEFVFTAWGGGFSFLLLP